MALEDYKAKKDWIFIGDAHIRRNESKELEVLLKFLRSESKSLGCLVILGDLFEFFFGFKPSAWHKRPSLFSDYLPVFKELERLYRDGVRIKYFEGNHDFFLNSFFLNSFNINIEVYPDGSEEDLGGKRTFIAHGDLSNQNDYGYRVFRRIIKNPLSYRIIQFAGPDLSYKVAKILSRRSYRRFHSGLPYKPLPTFREYARKKFLEDFEIVILGHSHFPERIEEIIGGRRFLYFNVGAWINYRSFLRYIPPDKFLLSRWKNGQ